MATEGGDAAVVARANPTIKHRFSSLRYSKVVKQLNPIQKGHIRSHHLEHLLNVPDHLMIPLSLLQWLVRHISHGGGGVFRHNQKTIYFNKVMVDKMFGFPPGSVPFALGSDDPDVVNEVEQLRRQYLKGKNIPIKHLESILLGTNNKTVFMRSFILYFITTILCPSTYNFVNPKYLYSLRDSDLLLVENLDLGTLCLNHLFDELDSWSNKISANPGDINKAAWIGGCLPVLAIGYMDFVDFNGNPGNIDYRLPRMLFIRNEDFQHLERLDRINNSREDYGALADIIDVDVEAPAVDGYSVEDTGLAPDYSPEYMDGIPIDAGQDGNDVENAYGFAGGIKDFKTSCRTEEAANNDAGDGLNIAICYAELPVSNALAIAEGFVTPDCNMLSPSGIVIPVSEVMPALSAAQKSIDKKNRKKRTAKTAPHDMNMSEIIIDADIEAFHTRFLKKKYFKHENFPTIFEIGVHSVSYDNFYKSFKTRGDVVDEVMCLHAHIYNDRAKYDASTKPYLKKFMFDSYITNKLMVDPSEFDKKFAVGGFKWVMSNGFEISNMDILHFPTVVSKQWVLISVNPLYDTTTEAAQEQIMNNLACNLKTVFKELILCCKDFERFKKFNPPNYPSHALLHQSGIYVMLYSENWTGEFMKNFSKECVPKYRMLRAYHMFYSIQNEIVAESFEKKKVRKNKRLKF